MSPIIISFRPVNSRRYQKKKKCAKIVIMDIITAAQKIVNDLDDDDFYAIEPMCSKNSSLMNVTPPHITDPSRVTIDKAIARGTFGDVFKGTLDGHITVAIKEITPNSCFREREIDIMKTLTEIPHKNVIELVHHCSAVEQGKIWIVMNLYPQTLHDAACVRPSSMSTSARAKLVRLVGKQLLSGLEHIHALNIMHRDLKPQNILWNPGKLHLVIADFGASKEHDSKQSTTYIATRFYRAPECILDNPKYDHKIDIWAAGCILGEIIQAKVLFAGNDSTDQLYKIFQRLGYPSNEDLAFINPELSTNTCRRPTKRVNRAHISEWLMVHGPVPKIISARTSKILECLLCLSPGRRKSAGEVLRLL